MKMPDHVPREHSNCSHAAHDHTLHARIHKPSKSMGRIPEAPPLENYAPAPYRHKSKNISSVFSDWPPKYGVEEQGQDGNNAQGGDDSASVAISEGNYAGYDPNKTYSIVITPIVGGSRAALLMKPGEQLPYGRDSESRVVSQHLEFEAEDAYQSHIRFESFTFPEEQQVQPKGAARATVVPKLNLISGGVGLDQISTAENSASRLGGWSVRRKKEKSSGAVLSSQSHPTTPKIPFPELHPRDDPGIPGVGWVEGKTTKRDVRKGANGGGLALGKPSDTSPDSSPRQHRTGSTSQSPKFQATPSQSLMSRRAVGIVGMVSIDAASRAGKSVSVVAGPSTSAVKSGRSELITSETASLASPILDRQPQKVTSTRGSAIHEGILEKLRVWVDEELDDQSEADSDDPDPVTTSKSMPARLVQFLKSPRTQKQERLTTPNTAREEQLCEWEDSARGKELAGNNTINNISKIIIF